MILGGSSVWIGYFRGSNRDFNRAGKLLTTLIPVDLGGHDIAIQAASKHRAPRGRRPP